MEEMNIAIVDFISSWSKRIGVCVEEAGASYRFFAADVKAEELEDYDGIIFTGSLDTCYDGGKLPDPAIFELGKPMLGICYGHQVINMMLGGEVKRANVPEHGSIACRMKDSPLFLGMGTSTFVRMSHNDEVVLPGEGLEVIAETDDCKIAACQDLKKKIFTVQFHPEAPEGNDDGLSIFRNFLRIVGD